MEVEGGGWSTMAMFPFTLVSPRRKREEGRGGPGDIVSEDPLARVSIQNLPLAPGQPTSSLRPSAGPDTG